MLHHRSLNPVVIRDWSNKMELFAGALDISASLSFETRRNVNGAEHHTTEYLRPASVSSPFLDTAVEPVPWPQRDGPRPPTGARPWLPHEKPKRTRPTAIGTPTITSAGTDRPSASIPPSNPGQLDHRPSGPTWRTARQRSNRPPTSNGRDRTASSEAVGDELDLHVSATHLVDPSVSPTGGAIVLATAVVQPDSYGTLRLRSRDPTDAPLIDCNFLAEPQDLRRMLEGVKLSRTVARDELFAPLLDR
jgi:hypothetical protein